MSEIVPSPFVSSWLSVPSIFIEWRPSSSSEYAMDFASGDQAGENTPVLFVMKRGGPPAVPIVKMPSVEETRRFAPSEDTSAAKGDPDPADIVAMSPPAIPTCPIGPDG